MVDLPKPSSERKFWDLHTPTTVDNPGDRPGDNEHKAGYVKTHNRRPREG